MFDVKGLNIQIKSDVMTLLEKALADDLGYAHVVVVRSEEDAFKICLEPSFDKKEVFCSPLATLSLHRTLYKQSLSPIYTDLKLDATTESRFLERQLSEKSSYFVLSHYQGVCTPTREIQLFCQQNNLFFIEDATQAFHKNEKSGASVTVFSFKHLLNSAVVPGAFVATDDAALASKLRLRAQGGYQKSKNWNYDLVLPDGNVQPSILSAQVILNALVEQGSDNEATQKIQMLYREALADSKMFTLPFQENLSSTAYFPVILSPALFCPKEDIYSELLALDIAVEVGLKPIYRTTAFLDESVHLFGVEEVYKGIILLPITREMSENDVRRIIETFKEVIDKYAYRGCSF